MPFKLPPICRCAPLLLLSGCVPAILDPRGPIAGADKQILVDSVLIMLAIIVPTILATAAFAFWFRASNTRARYNPEFVYSGRIELVVWSIPLLTILLLGGVAWIGSHELDPANAAAVQANGKQPLEIEVVSLDWKWLFIYPEQHVASINEAAIPAGVPIHLRLTSGSVMTAFFVPQLASMLYTMNGMASELWLKADQPGDYRGIASHLSGDGFPDMHFVMRAMPEADFTAWAAKAGQSADALDGQSYRQIFKQGTSPIRMFRATDPKLFTEIVTQEIPPAPGPEAGSYGVDVTPKPEH